MFRLALCGKNCELLEKIKSHIQSFAETYKNETKCILIEQYKQLASLRDDIVDGVHFDILMVEIDAHPHEDFHLLSEIRRTAADTIVILFSRFLDYDFTRLGYQIGAFRYPPLHRGSNGSCGLRICRSRSGLCRPYRKVQSPCGNRRHR